MPRHAVVQLLRPVLHTLRRRARGRPRRGPSAEPRSLLKHDGMSRRPRRDHAASSEPGTAALPRSLEGRLVGYRLLRRIASGERADVYLAVADDHEPKAPPATREVVGGDGGAADGTAS